MLKGGWCLKTGVGITTTDDRTARCACKRRRRLPRIKASKVPAPVGLSPPYTGTLTKQTNRNHRKLSHNGGLANGVQATKIAVKRAKTIMHRLRVFCVIGI